MYHKIKNSQVGECPKCESNDIDYGTIELDDDNTGYHITCGACGFSGAEWYKCNFDGIWGEE